MFTYALFATLILKAVDFFIDLTHIATDKAARSSVLTQLCAWAGGTTLVAIGAHAKVVAGVVLPGMGLALGKLDAGSILLVGLMAASLASAGADTRAAVDSSDSTARPPLLSPSPTP